MELDHIFICVNPGAHEAEALREFGLSEGTMNVHPGQGTANRRFFFRNAYLELLYLQNPLEAQSERSKPTQLFDRLTRKDGTVSPFGICFRPTSGSKKKAPFPSWCYKPIYLPENQEIEIGITPLTEPMWFYLSSGFRPDLGTNKSGQPLEHRNSFDEITSIQLTLPSTETLSKPALIAQKLTEIDIIEGDEHLAEVGFDSANRGQVHDFRPILPMIFKF